MLQFPTLKKTKNIYHENTQKWSKRSSQCNRYPWFCPQWRRYPSKIHAGTINKGNTNLCIVPSAACSGETAGYQTLTGTEAEFNVSCQQTLMWLTPPARAGIVKLSGRGEDAQSALRDALLTVPAPGAPLQAQQGVKKPPPTSLRSFCVACVCTCMNPC